MGNINDLDFDADRAELATTAASLVEANAELVRLRIFRAAFGYAIPLLQRHISRVKDTYPITSRAIADLINAYRAAK